MTWILAFHVHGGAGIGKCACRLPAIAPLPVTSGGIHVAVRLSLISTIPSRISPCSHVACRCKDIADTDATSQGCVVRRTQNFIRRSTLPSVHSHHFETYTFLIHHCTHTCAPHFPPRDKLVSHPHTDWRCGLSQSANCDRRVRTGALHPSGLHQLFDVSVLPRSSHRPRPSPLWVKRVVSFPRQWDA